MKLVNKLKNSLFSFFNINKANKEEKRPELFNPGVVTERNRKIRELKNINKQKVETSVKAVECPTCGLLIANTYECPICHKKGCSCCFIFNPNDNKYYCEECWELN